MIASVWIGIGVLVTVVLAASLVTATMFILSGWASRAGREAREQAQWEAARREYVAGLRRPAPIRVARQQQPLRDRLADWAGRQ
jgi:flagellar basal body-associated protein FliL